MELQQDMISLDDIARSFPKRPRTAHKGTFGRILFIAGAAGMTGAAVFAASAAMRTGTGLAYVCTPKTNASVIQTLIPEAICVDWDEVSVRLANQNPKEWNYDAIAFGPGMGRSKQTRRMLKAVLLTYTGPLVIDADGLNVLADDPELRQFASQYMGDIVLTPHVGEANRLLRALSGEDMLEEREEVAGSLIDAYRCIIVLKGHHTIIGRKRLGSPERQNEFFYNSTGNPGMATAGAGDVLTGVITSLIGQGMLPFEAAKTGVFLHGLAGDLAAKDKGEHGMIASDIVASLPYAIKKIINQLPQENSTGE